MKKTQKQALAAGVGAAAIAAAAAGVYFFTGKRGAKNRKKIGGVAHKIKLDVIKELKNLEKTGRPAYEQAVDSVAKHYRQLKHVDKADVAAAVNELKGHWDKIAKQIKQAGKSPRAAKRAAKKPAAKKPTARSSRKQRK